MHRFGWGMLLLFVGAAFAFGSMVRIVDVPGPARTAAPAHVSSARGDVSAAMPANAPLLVVPVVGVRRSDLRDSWGEARGGGTRGHQALDIMAPAGTPVIAAADGTIEKLYYSKGGGGITLYVRSPDGRWSYYYAHLQGYAPGVREGLAVRAGDPLGFVGDTGNAGAGNTHLHFGLARMQPGQGWWQGEPVDPYPLLAGNRAGS